METSTSDGTSLGTDLFFSKSTTLLYYGIRTIQHQRWFPATNSIFLHIFYSLKQQKKIIQ